jgi:K+-sensing histidine kinase KdpD
VILGVERIESLIQTIRNYLELPSLSFSRGDPEEVLSRALESFRTNARAKGIRIVLERGERLPEIYMDTCLLETAIGAVLENSIMRMPRGGDLAVKMRLEGDRAVITVRDSGPALDTGQMAEDLSPVHVLGGDRSYMNLAIARRIVEEHSGLFNLDASDQGGIRVKMSLPVDRRGLVRGRGL